MKGALSVVALILTLCACVAAGTVTPVAVTCTGTFSGKYPCSALIDGLTDDRAESSPGVSSYWLGPSYSLNETFTLDLGSVGPVTGFNIYNTHNGANPVANDRGTLAFTIWLSSTFVTPDTTSSSFGTDVLDGALGFYPWVDPNPEQSFTITPTYAQYVTFRVTDISGLVGAGLSEIEVEATPEPTTFFLAGIALVALGAIRRRN